MTLISSLNSGLVGVFYSPKADYLEQIMQQPLAKLKGDERKWAIESAARTLKDFARIKRDKPMLKAARAYLKQEIEDSKKGMTI